MNIALLKIILALVILALTLIAGWYPFHQRMLTHTQHAFPRGESLACGVFLGAGLLHMLSDAAKDFTRLGYHYPLACLLVGVTFLLFLLVEHIGREMHRHRGTRDKAFALIALLMLSIHAFLAGAALGLSHHYYLLLTLFFAIIAHKWAESFALAVRLNRSSMSVTVSAVSFALFVMMTPLGILLGDAATDQLRHHLLFPPIFESLAAGTFLYLGTLHGLERAVMVKECCDLHNFNYVILGFSIMAIVALF